MSIRRSLGRAVALLSLVPLVVAIACDDGTFAGSVGPTEATLGGSTFGGSTSTGTSGAALVGRWTHVDVTLAGVITQTEWAFGADGSFGRTVTTRTALGQAIAVDRAAGTWQGGAGT